MLQELLTDESVRTLINHFLSQFVVMSITIFLIPRLRVTSFLGAAWLLLGIAVMNAGIWSAHLFFQLPETLSFYAFELMLVNGAIFWILVKVLPGIEIQGFLPAIAAPVVFSLLSGLLKYTAGGLDWIYIISLCIEKLILLKDYFMSTGPSGPVE